MKLNEKIISIETLQFNKKTQKLIHKYSPNSINSINDFGSIKFVGFSMNEHVFEWLLKIKKCKNNEIFLIGETNELYVENI